MANTDPDIGYEKELKTYVDNERAAVKLAHYVGELLYTKGVELVLFRNHLIDVTNSEIINLHDYAENKVGKKIYLTTSLAIAEELDKLKLPPAKIDIGLLSYEWIQEGSKYASKSDFLKFKLSGLLEKSEPDFEPRDVVLFGFGRIGRLCARELVTQAGKGQQLRLRAIVARGGSDEQIIKRAALFNNDSVHGKFKGTVHVDLPTKSLVINGQRINIIDADKPEDVDYTKYGIENALVIDNTGVFKDRAALSRHRQAKGISRVLLTAPASDVPNIVYGINHTGLDLQNEHIYCAASCTTNAITPVLKVINDKFGIDKGHIETVHAYTNDQNLLDNMHKKPRRGRSAAINMVITSTGAGKAVAKVIPELEGKFTANAVRVPTPNGSLAIMHITVNRVTSVDEVNAVMKDAAINGKLVNQIYYSVDPELVSNDIIGNTCCSVFDAPATIVSKDGKNIVLYTWYDNEYGYTKQVIRLAKYVAKVRRLRYY
jgi:glyceraldehyde 3-phosphate dehydrogenase